MMYRGKIVKEVKVKMFSLKTPVLSPSLVSQKRLFVFTEFEWKEYFFRVAIDTNEKARRIIIFT